MRAKVAFCLVCASLLCTTQSLPAVTKQESAFPFVSDYQPDLSVVSHVSAIEQLMYEHPPALVQQEVPALVQATTTTAQAKETTTQESTASITALQVPAAQLAQTQAPASQTLPATISADTAAAAATTSIGEAEISSPLTPSLVGTSESSVSSGSLAQNLGCASHLALVCPDGTKLFPDPSHGCLYPECSSAQNMPASAAAAVASAPKEPLEFAGISGASVLGFAESVDWAGWSRSVSAATGSIADWTSWALGRAKQLLPIGLAAV